MSNPIPFSVAPALRSGTFKTSVMTYPGGYTSLSFSLTGMGTGAGSDYENTANAFTATVYYSTDAGVTYNQYDQTTWQGGARNVHGVVDPPPVESIGLGNLPAGCLAYVQVDLTGTFTVGVSGSVNP